MTMILNPLKNWDEFQNLCHDLWRLMWNDPNTQLNGRQGNRQMGVDIFGFPYYANVFHGVQCKGRNANYDSRLTAAEVDDECKDAEMHFKPGLESLVVATTSPRDPKVQEHCRVLTKDHTFPFKVSVWSWDDIEEEIQFRPDIMAKYYPAIKPENLPDSIVIDYTFVDDKIHAFFSRPTIQRAISYDYRYYLFPIVSELVDNSFSKGKAGQVKIEFKDSSLSLTDDGCQFNPETLLSVDGQGGAYTLRKLKGVFGDNLKFAYDYNNGQNVFSLIFPKGVLSTLMNVDYKITLNNNNFFGRPFAHQLAMNQFAIIPEEKKRIKVIVDTAYGLAVSNACQYFETALKNLKEGQFIEVLFTVDCGDVSYLNEQFKDRPITFKNL